MTLPLRCYMIINTGDQSIQFLVLARKELKCLETRKNMRQKRFAKQISECRMFLGRKSSRGRLYCADRSEAEMRELRSNEAICVKIIA